MNGEYLNSCARASASALPAKALYSSWKPESLGQGFGVKAIKEGKQIFQTAQNILLIHLLNTSQIGNQPCHLRRNRHQHLRMLGSKVA